MWEILIGGEREVRERESLFEESEERERRVLELGGEREFKEGVWRWMG